MKKTIKFFANFFAYSIPITLLISIIAMFINGLVASHVFLYGTLPSFILAILFGTIDSKIKEKEAGI